MKKEQFYRNLVKHGKRVLILLGLAVISFVVISTIQLNNSIDKSNRNIILNYNVQIANRLHDRFEKFDTSLISLMENIERINTTDEEALKRELNNYEDIWESYTSGILFSDNTNMLSDGSKIIFEDGKDPREIMSYSEDLIITPKVVNNIPSLLLVRPVNVSGIDGIFATIELNSLSSFLRDYGYGEYSFLALTQSNGNNIWKQDGNDLSGTGNCFEDLKLLKIGKNDSIEQMKTRMKVSMNGTIAYSKEGRDYYMAYVSLNVNAWYLLVSAHAESIDFTVLSRQNFLISATLSATIFLLILAGLFYLVQRNRNITYSNKKLKEANNLANQANIAKRDFLAKISHEIRTPLNGVMGMIELAKNTLEDGTQTKEYLNKASDSADFLLTLLNDVLDVSQIESGKQKLVDEVVDLEKMINELLDIMSILAEKKDIILAIDNDLKHNYIRGDYMRIKQIISNLINNAIKYTKPGGMVYTKISEDEENSKLIVSVQDNGIGIEKSKLDVIFDPFEQGNITNRTGVGLGLSIVKNFVDLMGGKISVTSEVGKGSTFEVEIPLVIVKDLEVEKKKVQSKTDLTGISILLAEDNEINAEIAIDLLMSKGAKVTLANDGIELVDIFNSEKEGTYDILLVDIRMPNKDGIEATKDIRKLDRPDALTIPIVAVTANAFEEQKEDMINAGMNDFVFKPFEINYVCECILKYVKKRVEESETDEE